ncbi:unnamed protein product [Alternaria alternata]
MKPHKKSIRDFFSPVPTNSQSAAASQSTLPQRSTCSLPSETCCLRLTHPTAADAKNAPTRQSNPPKSSAALPDAVSHVTHPPLSSSNPSVSTAPPTTRAASADAPPFNPSQTSANSGTSRRIESNGQQMVLNSDSDDDSLPDLDFGIPVTKVKALTTMTTTRSKRISEDQVDGLRKPVKKAKGDRINFSALVQTAQKNRETERQILEHKTALETPLEIPVNASITINEETLGQVVDDDDDPEKAHRLFQAMQRTNATQLESTFHFFKDNSDSNSIPMRAAFPIRSLPNHRWVSNFEVHPTPVDVPLSDPKVSDIIYKHMKNSPSFQVNKNTNYSHLAARLALLDIAIGPGLLDVPYQPLSSPTTSEAGSSPVSAPVPASSEVRDFNNQVDALAREFQLLGNSIVEAGAVVDLTIMDTKDSIERLRARLEHAVRIGGKKAHNVFGNDDEDTQLKVSKFFTKRMQNCTPAPLRGIFDGEDDVLSDVADSTKT